MISPLDLLNMTRARGFDVIEESRAGMPYYRISRDGVPLAEGFNLYLITGYMVNPD